MQGSVETIAAGDYDRAVPFTRLVDETGSLARSIVVLKEAAALTEQDRWVKERVGLVVASLQEAQTLADFGQRFFSGIMPELGGGTAAFYVVDSGGKSLTRVAGYGLAQGQAPSGAVNWGESLIGQCAAERKALLLSDLPPDYLRISSGLGSGTPASVMACPVISRGALLGVLELATFRVLKPREQALWDELIPLLGLGLESLQSLLTATSQALSLSASESQLRSRASELETMNTRLEEQARQVEEQAEELERQRQSLQETEAWFRQLVESAPDGLIVVDDAGIVVMANRQAEALLGFAAEELSGKALVSLIPSGLEAGNTDKAFALRKDGTQFPAEIRRSQLQVMAGRPGSLCVSLRNISERRRVETLVAAQQARLQHLLDTAPVGVAISVDGVVQFANPRIGELVNLKVGSVAAHSYVRQQDRVRIMELVQKHGIARDVELQMHG